uniref:RNA-dependent RNA polymerase n=1 Tax=Kumba picobirna-like virus TaxID=2497867 RepID=A0A451FN36_9VIRU|nr:RNA-dependent RNA polymerase [Kumba picobirna-like virus]
MKTQQSPEIKRLISLMQQIDAEVHKMPKPDIPETIQRGLDVSKAASAQQDLVEMTPLFRNALEKFDGFTEDSRLRVNDPETKAEKWFHEATEVLLTKFNGTSKVYDENKPLLSVDHYNVQCWQNNKENWRDIQPGQADERLAAAEEYTKATDSKRVFDLLERDKLFQKAVLLVLNALPEVRASEEFLEINLPFMSKHTNVNDPFWQNDRNLAPDGRTYAQVTMDMARKIKSGKELYKYNLSTMYGRNQRGKGRLIIAVSRIVNLWLNRLEAKEIDAYRKKCSLFVGYGDDKALKEALRQMVTECLTSGLKMRNMDQSRYDRHVSYGFILLLGAMSIVKANGARSKDIAFWRAVLMSKTYLVNGLTGQIKEIFGRIFSGFIDTNRGGGIINAIITTYCCMKQDPNYSSYVYDLIYYMLVMGDDNCFVYKILDHKKMIEDMKILGFDVNPEKDEYGPMFLQYRLFEDPQTHEQVMAYPWTRVVRSMLFKETGRGLGPAGWTLAFWQQLSKLIEYPLALKIATNLILPFDREGLMLDRPVSEIIDMIQEEDRAKLEEAKTVRQANRVTITADKLNDGDPTKSRFAESLSQGGSGYLTDLQAKIREARDPNFLASLGIRVPAA